MSRHEPPCGSPPVRSLAGLAVVCARAWWPQVLALMIASGIVTATIAGAIGVGDAMRRGLLDVARARLGRIAAAILSDAPFREGLAREVAAGMAADGGAPVSVVPAIVIEIAVESPPANGRERTVSRAVLLACDDPGSLGFASAPGPLAAETVAVNAALAETLGLAVGQPLVLRAARRSDVPADSPLGRRLGESTSRRLKIAAILPRGGVGDFSLRPTQVTGGLVLTSLAVAHDLLGEGRVANALLCATDPGGQTQSATAVAERARGALRPTLDDYGLSLGAAARGGAEDSSVRLTSRRLLLEREIDRVAASVLGPLGGRPSLVVLANAMRPPGGTGSIPYSTIVGIDVTTHPVGSLVDDAGVTLPLPGRDEIVIDRWMADDFASQGSPVGIGDTIAIDVFLPETLHGRVVEATHRLRVAGIAAMRGAAVARSLVPDVEGITDEASIADWDPPFPFDSSRVRTTPPHDEDDRYWKAHGAAPKAFVSLDTARTIAASRFGETTAWHVPAAAVTDDAAVSDAVAGGVRSEAVGFRVVPLADEAAAAARGATPFGGLFVGLSLFVVIAGLILEWLLFHVLVAAHRRETGMLAAIGWPRSRVSGLLLGIGSIAVAGGTAVGLAVAPLWSAFLLAWLAGAWDAAVATGSRQVFGAAAPRLAAMWPGGLAAAAVSLVAVWWAARRAAGALPVPMLRGESSRGWQAAARPRAVVRSLADLARRGLASRLSRTFSVVAIVALAEFLIVVVSAFALRLPSHTGDRSSPTGGWTHIASFGEPTGIDPSDPDTAATLGLSDVERQALAGCAIERIRSNAGDDASCTNLYAATRPTVLGVGPSFVARGGFRFVAHAPLSDGGGNPWALLEEAGAPGEPIAAILDQATAQWALRLGGVGATFMLPAAGDGAPQRLRIVGLLEPGILQGAVIVSERNFSRLEPRRSGYALALIDASALDPVAAKTVGRAIAAAWADAGVAVETTIDRLRGLYAVQNMFLSGFQMLGSLGLLLGTLGVAAVQMQGVFERIGPLSVMRSLGFTLARIRGLIVLESLFMVGAGIVMGAVAGLLALSPLLATGRAAVPWKWLGVAGILTIAASMAAGFAAARGGAIPGRPPAE